MKSFIHHIAGLAPLVLAASTCVAAAASLDDGKAQADPDGKTIWYDARNLLVEGKGWTNTESFYDRLPAKAKGVVRPPVWDLSHHSAGLCVRFATDARTFQVRWVLTDGTSVMHHMPLTGMSGVDLYARDESHQWQFEVNGSPVMSIWKTTAQAQTNTCTLYTTYGREHRPYLPLTNGVGREQRLYLPLYNGVKSVEIGIQKGQAISLPANESRRKPIVFYGTSITQGGCASRPGMAFTAIVGRRLEIPVINLGFSGNGKLEPEMVDLLAELDPAIFVIDSLWNMSPDEVGERVEPCVRKLRAAHPETPILLVENCTFLNASPTESGGVLKQVFDKLSAAGVRHLHFLPNKDMLGGDSEGTVDCIHPNDLGMMRMADGFCKALAPLLPDAR